MCNDFSRADLLAPRIKSIAYPSAERLGIVCFSQAHDESGAFAVAGRCHYEEYAIEELTRKVYLRMLYCGAARVGDGNSDVVGVETAGVLLSMARGVFCAESDSEAGELGETPEERPRLS